MTKDPLLIQASFVTYMIRQDHCSQDGKLGQLWERIEKEIRKVVDEFDCELDCYRSSVYGIGAGSNRDNSGHCVVCDEWISAQNKPKILQGLGIGAEHRGDLYCRQHLPEDSPLHTKLNPSAWTEEYFNSIQGE
jgi:hypothetical protein